MSPRDIGKRFQFLHDNSHAVFEAYRYECDIKVGSLKDAQRLSSFLDNVVHQARKVERTEIAQQILKLNEKVIS